jgi:hypothetical protein
MAMYGRIRKTVAAWALAPCAITGAVAAAEINVILLGAGTPTRRRATSEWRKNHGYRGQS